jgi:tRNA(Ile)-lysidine synthase
LLLALEELSSELGCALSVTHFNHQLRGEDSQQDEQFVRELADRLQLPIHVSAADVRACASQAGENLEATARRLRYRYFFSLVDNGIVDRVAVGHTADDQAETVLHRLLRGTGIRGLAGIHPVVAGRVIRPLLETRRQVVLDWLSSRQQTWREDSTNQDLRFLRNRIRRQLLPLLAEMNPRVVEILTHTAEIARDEELFWDAYLEPLAAQHLRGEGEKVWVEIAALRRMPRAVARRLLRYALRMVGGPPAEGAADFLQTRRLLDLAFSGRGGSSLALPQGVVARKESSSLLLELAEPARTSFPGFEYPVRVPAVIPIPEIGSSFAFELIPLASGKARYNGEGKDLLDRRVSEGSLVLRNWRPGDAYRQRGHRKSRKFKELFQRQRVSKSERTRWPVVVAGGEIVWSRTWGSAEGFSPGSGSTEALRIRETKS